MVRGTGVVYLERGDVERVYVRGVAVAVSGVGYDIDGEWEIGRVRSGYACAAAEDRGTIRVLLAHTPDAVNTIQQDAELSDSIDLVICGHTHGGQVAIPFIGPIMNNTSLPRRIAGGGLHEWGGVRMYVSRGIGLERGGARQLRFFARTEITVLDFVGELSGEGEGR